MNGWRNARSVRQIVGTVVVLTLASCGGDEERESSLGPVLPSRPFDYTNVDSRFGEDRTPADRPVTNEGATLGRVLFFDKRLSQNDTTSCGTCHLQEKGFTDGLGQSVGFAGESTRRNSQSVVNLRFDTPRGIPDSRGRILGEGPRGGFFWDQRASTLEDLVLQPLVDPIEMGSDLATISGKLQALEYYPPLFQAAFGSPEVTTDRIARALVQFLRAIVSTRSRFDLGLERTGGLDPDFDSFTAEENRGKEIFSLGGCPACHSDNMGRSISAFNNGLDRVSTVDRGLGEPYDDLDTSTGRDRFDGLFKAPSLRNVEVTGPYMHDGRMATLEQVVEHYNSGVAQHPNLSGFMIIANGSPRRLNLSAQGKSDLVAFLKTLTDRALLTDPKFSDPFPP